MIEEVECGCNLMLRNRSRKPTLTENLKFKRQGPRTTAKVNIDLMNASQVKQNETSVNNMDSSRTLDANSVA